MRSVWLSSFAIGEVSAAEVMDAAIERIEAVNPKLNFISVKCYELGRSLAAGEIPAGRSWACPPPQGQLHGLRGYGLDSVLAGCSRTTYRPSIWGP